MEGPQWALKSYFCPCTLHTFVLVEAIALAELCNISRKNKGCLLLPKTMKWPGNARDTVMVSMQSQTHEIQLNK